MLLSAVITVAGVGVMVAVILPKQISKAIAAASDTNGTQGQVQKDGDEKKGEGDEKKGDGDEKKEDADETADPTAEPDDPKKPVAIVPEGESIVVNPANSGAPVIYSWKYSWSRRRRGRWISKAVESKTKQLQAVTTDSCGRCQSLSDPATKDVSRAQLKLAYQQQLGSASHQRTDRLQVDYAINPYAPAHGSSTRNFV